MRKWMEILVNQLDLRNPPGSTRSDSLNSLELSEEKATILFFIDTLNKNLFEIETHPVRKVRETLDEFAREILQADQEKILKVLFRLRQFISSYRLDEYTFVQKTFEDFRSIIWDFVEQLSDDIAFETESDNSLKKNLSELKEAVESNSINSLRDHCRLFIDSYVENQTRAESRKRRRIDQMKKSLDRVKKELTNAHDHLNRDHLTNAFNRRKFDDHIRNLKNLCSMCDRNVSLIMMDIDHFKSINDRFGHANGDYVLQECVKFLNDSFSRQDDFVARIGGEEFAILLLDFNEESAAAKADLARERIKNEALVSGDMKIQFTVSMGVAQLQKAESIDQWMKRADMALYHSKTTGRNRVTRSTQFSQKKESA